MTPNVSISNLGPDGASASNDTDGASKVINGVPLGSDAAGQDDVQSHVADILLGPQRAPAYSPLGLKTVDALMALHLHRDHEEVSSQISDHGHGSFQDKDVSVQEDEDEFVDDETERSSPEGHTSPAAFPLPLHTFSPSLASVHGGGEAAHGSVRRTSGDNFSERDLLRGYQKLLSSCSDFTTAVHSSAGTPTGSSRPPQGRSGFQSVPAWTPDSIGQQRRTTYMVAQHHPSDGLLHDSDAHLRTHLGSTTSLGWTASLTPPRGILRHSSASSPPHMSPPASIDRGDVFPKSDQIRMPPGAWRGSPARGQQLSSLEVLAAEAYALRLELQEIGML